MFRQRAVPIHVSGASDDKVGECSTTPQNRCDGRSIYRCVAAITEARHEPPALVVGPFWCTSAAVLMPRQTLTWLSRPFYFS